MPLADLNQQQRGLLDYLFVPQQEEVIEEVPVSQSFFNLPPPPPVSRYFAGRGSRDPYGFQEKAREFQMMQQAERDASVIGQLISGVDPTSPNYPQQRMALIARAPLAEKDPRGKALLDAADFNYQQSRTADPNRSVIQQAAMAGVTPEEIAQFTDQFGRVNVAALSNLAGERQRTYKESQRAPARDNTLADLERAYNVLVDAGAPKEEREKIRALMREQVKVRFSDSLPTSAAPTGMTEEQKREAKRKQYNY